MVSGGARNRSGPAADPTSFRSEAKGLVLSRLPAAGFDGDVPDFPVPDVDGRTLSVWTALWRTPQAAAWSTQTWRWVHVADLARLMVMSEDPKAPIGVWGHIRQARADLGLTPAGLIENGWAIAEDEVAELRDGVSPARRSSRDRLKALNA